MAPLDTTTTSFPAAFNREISRAIPASQAVLMVFFASSTNKADPTLMTIRRASGRALRAVMATMALPRQVPPLSPGLTQ